MTAWWTAVPPTQATHHCSGADHPIVWSAGELHVPAHGDPDAERALGALGGAVPACVRLQEWWEAWSTDPALVTLGRRPGEEALGFADEAGLPVAAAVHTPPVRRRGAETARREAFVELLSLPAPFVDRLVLTAMAAAAEAWADDAFRERHGLRLGAALAGRARPALERLGGQLAAPGEAVTVQCAPAASRDPLTVRAERSARGLDVRAAVPLRWLPSVWGAGLSEPDGHLVSALRADRDDGYEVEVVEWAPDGAAGWTAILAPAVVVRGAAGDWRVRRDG